MTSADQPVTPFAYDVFLSHNPTDKPRVRRLAKRLRAAGLRVWVVPPKRVGEAGFEEWVIQPRNVPSPVGRERMAEGWGRDRELAIERRLEAARTLACPAGAGQRRRMPCLSPAALGSDSVGLACPAVAAERRWKRSSALFRDTAIAGRRCIPLLLVITAWRTLASLLRVRTGNEPNVWSNR